MGALRDRWRRIFASRGSDRLAEKATASQGGGDCASSDALQYARALAQAGRFGLAYSVLVSELIRNPNHGELTRAVGELLLDWRRFSEALPWLRRAGQLVDPEPSLALQVARCAFLVGDRSEARFILECAARQFPEVADLHAALGLLAYVEDSLARAEEHYARVLALEPDHVDARIGMGDCCLRQRRFAEAEGHFRHALVVAPNRAHCIGYLADTLGAQGRYEEALRYFERAERLRTNDEVDAEIYVNHGTLLRHVGRTHDAIALFERHLAEAPSVEGAYRYAMALLTAGRMPEGWQQYEFRWLRAKEAQLRLKTSRPAWDGQDVSGARILLHIEQGLGDTIQFIRYAQLIKRRGATVILRAQESLCRIMQAAAGVDQVICPSDPLPEFDYYAYLLSLPCIFGTTLKSIPSRVPYLGTNSLEVDKWRERAPDLGRLRIGIVWRGNPLHANDLQRSVGLAELRPILHAGNVNCFSIQKDATPQELEALTSMQIPHLGRDLADFADTAAILEVLDLLICVDTSVAHLAGALGRPVWVMLPTPADFRWLEEREDSPWYPSMRLFRQAESGSWGPVIERIGNELTTLGASGKESRRLADPRASTSRPRPDAPDESEMALADLGLRARPRGLGQVAVGARGILQYRWDMSDEAMSLHYYGEWLEAHLKLLLLLVTPGAVIAEIGAGIGAHTPALSSAVGATGMVYVWEEDRQLRRMLAHNLRINGIGNAIVMQRGLVGMERQFQNEVDRCAEAPRDTLDDLRLVRLDVLLAKGPVLYDALLTGGYETFQRLSPVMFLDMNGTEASSAVQFLETRGYRAAIVELPLFGVENHARRRDDIWNGKKSCFLIGIPPGLHCPPELATLLASA